MSNCLSSIIHKFPKNTREWASTLSDDSIITMLNTIKSVSDIKMERCEEKIENSAKIGLSGEAFVESILKQHFKVINSAKQGKRGDLIVMTGMSRILSEVKNYSRTVPSTELEKFYRDIDSNASISGAIMISLSSKIVGKRRYIELEEYQATHGKISIIYLSLKDIETKDLLIASCVDMLNCFNSYKIKTISSKEKITRAVEKINSQLDNLSIIRTLINETNLMLNKQFGKMTNAVISAEVHIKQYINEIKLEYSSEQN